MELRSPYNYDRELASELSGLAMPDVEQDRTKQEFKEETDINTILRRFNVTGQLPTGVRMPTYADFETVIDFQSAANAMALARESFDAMPADIRRRFDNDPQLFVSFASDPANEDEARRIGLVPARAPVESAASLSASPAVPGAVVAPEAPVQPSAAGSTPST